MSRPFLFASTAAAVLAFSVAARADFATPPGEVAVAAPPALAVAAPPPARDVPVAVPEQDAPISLLSVRFEGGPAWATVRPMGGYVRLSNTKRQESPEVRPSCVA
jgi:hypothetical protein